MKSHYLQHVPFEGLGSIEPWVKKCDHTVTCSRLYLGDALPSVKTIDWLIIMGGPMSVHDEREYPWLADEEKFIERAIEADKTVLGICLGAQLLAHVLGTKVYPNANKEIGWFPVEKVSGQAAAGIGSVMADVMTAFHWHGETFDLPDGSIQLGRSEACENQAFIYEDRVVALQYHLETTRASAEALIKHCAHEIIEAPYIQTKEQMLSDHSKFDRINGEMEKLLEYLQTIVP